MFQKQTIQIDVRAMKNHMAAIWFGRVPMPGADDWMDEYPSIAPPTATGY